MGIRTDAAFAAELDKQDELAPFRDEFVVDDPELIYVDGNSLGRLPKRTLSRVSEVLQKEWGGRLIRAWNEGWVTAPSRIGAKIARLLGCGADEVIVTDSTSVNLFKLVLAALFVARERTKVVTDELNFPSDLYILQGALGLVRSHDHLSIASSPDGITVPLSALAADVDRGTALVSLSHTTFKSGFVHDMAAVTDLAHRAGALMLWDVSHSVGAMPLALSDAGVDMAVGCTYKYVNGGPGSPAFLYVRRDLQDSLSNPVSGWFGQYDPFAFGLEYRPASGIRRFLTGTPPVLSLAAIEAGVDLLLEAGLEKLRSKSVRQTEYLVALWEELLAPLGFTLNSPRDSRQRGSHVSLGHPDGLRIDRALVEEMHVLPDFRAPDNIRIGIAPIYTSFAEVREAVMRMRAVVVERRYEKYPREGLAVT